MAEGAETGHGGDLYAGHLSGWGSRPWCHACQSRTVRWHCSERGCRKVTCLKCMAETISTGAELSLAYQGVERLRP